jgi:hypothetical protein
LGSCLTGTMDAQHWYLYRVDQNLQDAKSMVSQDSIAVSYRFCGFQFHFMCHLRLRISLPREFTIRLRVHALQLNAPMRVPIGPSATTSSSSSIQLHFRCTAPLSYEEAFSEAGSGLRSGGFFGGFTASLWLFWWGKVCSKWDGMRFHFFLDNPSLTRRTGRRSPQRRSGNSRHWPCFCCHFHRFNRWDRNRPAMSLGPK